MFGLRVKLDRVPGTGRRRGSGKNLWICAVLGWGWGGLSLRQVANNPPTPLCSSFFFPSGELHIPSVCVTNLKPSFPRFDCLCQEPQAGTRREKENKRGRGEGRGRVVAVDASISFP